MNDSWTVSLIVSELSYVDVDWKKWMSTYAVLTDWPHISYVNSIIDRELWVMAIAGSRPDQHVTLRPEVKYVGNMHGDEVWSILYRVCRWMLIW